MRIRVVSCPQIGQVASLLTDFLYPLNLPVDASFAADGTYHVPASAVIQAFRNEKMPHLAHEWEIVINQKNWTHVMIPAECCEIVGQTEMSKVWS